MFLNHCPVEPKLWQSFSNCKFNSFIAQHCNPSFGLVWSIQFYNTLWPCTKQTQTKWMNEWMKWQNITEILADPLKDLPELLFATKNMQQIMNISFFCTAIGLIVSEEIKYIYYLYIWRSSIPSICNQIWRNFNDINKKYVLGMRR